MPGTWGNQSSGLINNSSFNFIFGNLEDSGKQIQPNSFMLESGEKSKPDQSNSPSPTWPRRRPTTPNSGAT